LYVRYSECAKALMAIAETAAVLDSSGRRERELESENEVWFEDCPNVALGATIGL